VTTALGLDRGSVVTIGTFDGVHIGHRAVLAEITRRAERSGRASAVVTFEPHPLEVVNPAAAPPLLSPGDERLEALAETSVDHVMVLRFTPALAALSPEEFVHRVLLRQLGMRELVIGHDHGFGRNRSGDVGTLRALGSELGFDVDVVAAVGAGDLQVSSSRIRRAVAGGDLDTAALMLGRRYSVSALVSHGAGRGAGLGVPTANLAGIPSRKLLPPDGVYAVVVETRGGVWGGMLNQGGRPTFAEEGRTLEAHLFGFSGSLYGERVRLSWVRRLRDTRAFARREDLVSQLARDRADALAALGAAGVQGLNTFAEDD
jgi:riboflavin kinase/FMN adenylyltransferase